MVIMYPLDQGELGRHCCSSAWWLAWNMGKYDQEQCPQRTQTRHKCACTHRCSGTWTARALNV